MPLFRRLCAWGLGMFCAAACGGRTSLSAGLGGSEEPPGAEAGIQPGVDAEIDASREVEAALDAQVEATLDATLDGPSACDSSACLVQRSCSVPMTPGCGQVAVPGGTFVLGGDTDAYLDTPAAGTMSVSPFSIDAYEVTVARFRQYWQAGSPPPPTDPIAYPGGPVPWGGTVSEPQTAAHSGDPDCTWNETVGSYEAHPIDCIDWYTAQAFCVWDGGRCPGSRVGVRGAGLARRRAHRRPKLPVGPAESEPHVPARSLSAQ